MLKFLVFVGFFVAVANSFAGEWLIAGVLTMKDGIYVIFHPIDEGKI